MKKDIRYLILDISDILGWEAVEGLFLKMYGQMDDMGLMLPLTGDGAEKWLKAAKNTAGKFGIVVLAQEGDKAIGFAQGLLKFLPDYLGGEPVGSITHVFVDDAARRNGIGRDIVQILEEWFHSKKVQSVELQVISGNPAAKKFWLDLGYGEELTQYRKFPST